MPVIDNAQKRRITQHAAELVKELGLTQGSIEIHCHNSRPKAIDVHDKSFKVEYDDEATMKR